MDKEELMRRAEGEFEEDLDAYMEEWEQTMRDRMEGGLAA